MKLYNIVSKIALFLLSIAFLVIAYLNDDGLLRTMLYINTVAVSIFSLDFLFYALYSENGIFFDHFHFSVFPISRYQLLIKEIFIYFKRPELLIFIISVYLLLLSFYIKHTSVIILFTVSYMLQLAMLFYFLFTLKNIINKSNYRTTIKNYVISFYNLLIIITVFSEKIPFIELIFYYTPFTSGFFSSIIPSISVAMALSIAFVFVLALIIITNIRFKEWPTS
jgi:hypothetical protein